MPDARKLMRASTTIRKLLLGHAAREYAKALKDGLHVPDKTMKVMRLAMDYIPFDEEKSEREQVKTIIVQNLYDKDTKIINIPNKIPPFLAGSVTDKTANVHSMIDDMELNPHIAEHMKHSVGYYYDGPQRLWNEQFNSLKSKLKDIAEEYKLLDDAVKADADLRDVKYIVIPDVGERDEAITSRTDELDVLFEKNPRLTLVVAFADDETSVGNYFCGDSATLHSTLSRNVKKLSFTGKNLRTVGDFFFFDTFALTAVDFRGLTALHTIGNLFCAHAFALTAVDFRGLSALKTVGGYFFIRAIKLKALDFRGLTALHTVCKWFFSNAYALTSLDLRGLSALKTVGDYFISHARSLTTIDFRGLSAFQTVGDYCFYEANALTSILVENADKLRMIQDKYEGNAQINIAPQG